MASKKKFMIFLKVLLLLAIGLGLFYGWLFGCLVLVFAIHSGIYFICLSIFALALFTLAVGAFFRLKLCRRIAYSGILLSVVVSAAAAGWRWWSVGRYPVVEQEVEWWKYRPYAEDNLLVDVVIPEEFQLSTNEDHPRLNGAYALYPIYAAMCQKMYPKHLTDSYDFLSTNGSDIIYDELMKGKRDLIFALAPSKKQMEDASAAGIEYELTPFCKDAFVFYVNAKNPIDNLTTDQIKGIYSGKITNWKEVCSAVDEKIIAFQRNEGSGSQTTLQKLMGDTPIMAPLKEDRVGGMGEIINDTANYRNYNAAIGFSFRYYATELLENKQVKLLSIDGVQPTVENIRNGSYPFVATAYMVTARPRSDNVRKIVEFMCSPTGQDLVEKTGYIAE